MNNSTETDNAVQNAPQAEMIPVQETAPAVQKKPLLSSAKRFIGKTLAPLKGGDTAKMIEEFTSEVSLVAEGLSEDQERISRLIDNVAAQQTTFENDTDSRLEKVQDDLKNADKRFRELENKLAKVEKQVQEKKIKKVEGWTGFIRALTWLVGVIAAAWIIVTILNKVIK